MMPWDWIGIVTTRNETFLSTLTNGTMTTSPGFFSPTTRPKRKTTPFRTVARCDRENEEDEDEQYCDNYSRYQSGHFCSPFGK
jgi:hypothetical protein